jgi:hypothetical protein
MPVYFILNLSKVQSLVVGALKSIIAKDNFTLELPFPTNSSVLSQVLKTHPSLSLFRLNNHPSLLRLRGLQNMRFWVLKWGSLQTTWNKPVILFFSHNLFLLRRTNGQSDLNFHFEFWAPSKPNKLSLITISHFHITQETDFWSFSFSFHLCLGG